MRNTDFSSPLIALPLTCLALGVYRFTGTQNNDLSYGSPDLYERYQIGVFFI